MYREIIVIVKNYIMSYQRYEPFWGPKNPNKDV